MNPVEKTRWAGTRRSVFVAVGSLALVVWVFATVQPAHASATSVEEQAALLLFKEGKDLYKQKRYEAALERFESASKVVKKEVLTFYLGMTYEKLGKHQAALFYLMPLVGNVPKGVEVQRRAAETNALWLEAKRWIKSDDCVSAYPWLLSLKGRLRAEKELWRAKYEAKCLPRSTVFAVDSSRAMAAHQIFLEARRHRDMGRLERAAALLKKVRSLVDDLVVHEETFDVLVRLGRWADAAAVAEPIAEIWFHSDGHGLEFQEWWLRERVCTDYAPLGAVRGDAAVRYVDDVSSVLKLNAAAEKSYRGGLGGDEPIDHSHVDLSTLDSAQMETMNQALVHGQSMPLLGAWLDSLVHAKSCAHYLSVRGERRFRRIVPERHRTPDARCVLVRSAVAIDPVTLSDADRGTTGRAYLGWALVGGGLIFAGGSGYFAYRQSQDFSQMEHFSDQYNALSDEQKREQEGNSFLEQATGAHRLAQEHQRWILFLGGAALVSSGVGIYFLLNPKAAARGREVSGSDASKGIEWVPVLTPTGGGILGRF